MSRRILIVGACVVLVALLMARALSSKPLPVSFAAASAADAESRARMDSILDRRVTFQFRKIRIEPALKQISETVGIPIQIEIGAYKVDAVPIDPVSLDIKNVRLRSALNDLLNPLDLTWATRDEGIWVSTPEGVGIELSLEVYPVRDLVMLRSKQGTMFRYRHLIDSITGAVAPNTWDAVGGPGGIQALPAAGAVVISQTREVHEQIALLLTALRKSREEQAIRPGDASANSTDLPPGPQASSPQPGAPNQSATGPAKNPGAPGSTAPNVTAPK